MIKLDIGEETLTFGCLDCLFEWLCGQFNFEKCEKCRKKQTYMAPLEIKEAAHKK